MTKKPVVAVDFDDVVVPYAQRIVYEYNRQHHAAISLQNIYVPGTFGNPDAGWKHDPAGAWDWIKDHLSDKVALGTPPIKQAKKSFKRLADQYSLVLLTGRPTEVETVTKTWLNLHLPEVFSSVLHSGDANKSAVCLKIDAKYLIDDNPHTIEECGEAGINGILFGDYPWNQADELPKGVVRAKNWDEVLKILLPNG